MTNEQNETRNNRRWSRLEVELPHIWAKVQMNMVIAPAIKAYTEKWLRA